MADTMETGSFGKSQSIAPLTPEDVGTSRNGKSCCCCSSVKTLVLVSVLMVVIFVAVGCLTYILGFLRPWQFHSNYQQEHVVGVKDINGQPYSATIEVNVATGEEIYRNGYSDTAIGVKKMAVEEDESDMYLVRDVNKKLDALVVEADSVCLLSAYDANDEVSPVELVDFLDSYSADTDFSNEVTIHEMDITDTPIPDIRLVSDVIASHCADMTSYWSVIINTTTTCDGQGCEDDDEDRDDDGNGDNSLIAQHTAEVKAVGRKRRGRVCRKVLKTVCRLSRRIIVRLICNVVSKLVCKLVDNESSPTDNGPWHGLRPVPRP
ncbi:uncharacterized protein [Ptychodera flava]|uniref:uncharacterized protein n=1 Tax=Ptychodera flava TaxID=63121 RepID=UPI00396A1C8D